MATATSASEGKRALLTWCARQCEPFGVSVRNFHRDWADGRAFCAIIASCRPSLLDFQGLVLRDASPEEALELAFSTAERRLGVERLVDVESYTMLDRPEELSTTLYVAVLHKALVAKKPISTARPKPKGTAKAKRPAAADSPPAAAAERKKKRPATAATKKKRPATAASRPRKGSVEAPARLTSAGKAKRAPSKPKLPPKPRAGAKRTKTPSRRKARPAATEAPARMQQQRRRPAAPSGRKAAAEAPPRAAAAAAARKVVVKKRVGSAGRGKKSTVPARRARTPPGSRSAGAIRAARAPRKAKPKPKGKAKVKPTPEREPEPEVKFEFVKLQPHVSSGQAAASPAAAPAPSRPRRRGGPGALAGKLRANARKAGHRMETEEKEEAPRRAPSAHVAALSAGRPLLRPAGSRGGGRARARSRSASPPRAGRSYLTVDEEDLAARLRDMDSPDSDTNWLLLDVLAGGVAVFSRSGSMTKDAGIDEARPHLRADMVQFLLFRYPAWDSSARAGKVAVITWLGEEAPATFKAKSNSQRNELAAFARRYVTKGGEMVVAGDADELTYAAFVNQVRGNTGVVLGGGGGSKDERSRAALLEAREREAARRRAEERTAQAQRFALVGGRHEGRAAKGLEAAEAAARAMVADPGAAYASFDIDADAGAVSASTAGGPPGVPAAVLDPSSVAVLLVRSRANDYGGAAPKIVYAEWVGRAVPPRRLAAARELLPSVRAAVKRAAGALAAEFETGDAADLAPASLATRVAGSRVRGQTTALPSAGASLGRQGSSLSYEGGERAVADAVASLVSAGGDVPVGPDGLAAAVDAADALGPAWVAVAYAGGKRDALAVAARGGPREDLTRARSAAFEALLLNDRTVFAACRALDVPPHQAGAAVRHARPRYFLVWWQGERVGVLQKGLSSHHFQSWAAVARRAVESRDAALGGGHVRASHADELTPAALRRELKMAADA